MGTAGMEGERLQPGPMSARRYEFGLVGLMFFVWGIVFLDRMSQLYLMPYIARDLALTDTEVGVLASAMAISWAVSSLLFGALSDRVGRKVVLVPLTVAFSVLSGLSGLARSFGELLSVRAVMGVAEGPCWSVMNALVEQSSHPSRRGRNIGIVVSAGALIGLAVAPVLTTQIAARLGWRLAFFVVGIPGLAVAVIMMRFVKEPPLPAVPKTRTGSVDWISPLRHRNVWLCAIAAAGFMSWLFLQSAFAPLYMTRVEGLSPRVAGWLLGAAGLGSFVLGILGPSLSDRFGRRAVLAAMALLSALLPVAMVTHGLYAHIWLLALILFLTQGGQAIAALAIVLIPAESVPSGSVGAAIGLVTLVGEVIGGTVAPVAAGRLAETWGLALPLWMAAAAALIVFCAALLMKIEREPRALHVSEPIHDAQLKSH